MLQTIVIGLVLLVLACIAFVLFRAYRNGALKMEAFQAAATPGRGAPAPAALTVREPAAAPPRVVSPAGPNPPSAAPPVAAAPPKLPPPETANDPYDEVNSAVPIKDNLRHPENSFGPGVPNTGTVLSAAAGIASADTNAAASKFSPEFAQNGGEFYNGIFANDTGGDGSYATV